MTEAVTQVPEINSTTSKPAQAISTSLDEASRIPRGWPSSPKAIRIPTHTIISSIMVDIALLSVTVTFLAFALIVNMYDGASVAEHRTATERLQSASKYGPTIYPILFASVFGRASHAILIWRLEKGERIGVLDTLAGSSSLTSVVVSQCHLRQINLFGLALIAVWALSPIGGQGSIRQMTTVASYSSQPASFTYMVPDGNLEGYQNSGVSANLALVNSQYLAAMLAPEAVKRSTLDLWGNVKVPLIEYYEQSSLSDREGWFTVNPEDPAEQDVYSSLIGIPMSGASQSPFIDYRMNVQTMYLRLNCSLDPFGDLLLPEGSFNYSGSKSDSWLWWFEDTFSTESSRSQVNPSALEPFVFGYSSKTFSWYANIECAIMTTYVEMEIKCPNTSACTASRLRRSTLDHPPPASTLFDLPKNWNFFASSFIKSVPGRSAYPSLIDTYLTDPLDPVIKQSVTANLTKQSAEVYAVRLVQLINAYWTILNGPYAINGGLKDDTAYLDPNITFLGEPGLTDELIARTWRTQGSKSTQTTVIRAHKEWVAALSISSIALILAGLIPPLLRYFIKGPDILMNISSLSTRNNPYIPLPTHATYMDAADRSRLLRELKVRFGDVGDDMEIGSLAIGSHDVSVMPVIGRIRKGRLYD